MPVARKLLATPAVAYVRKVLSGILCGVVVAVLILFDGFEIFELDALDRLFALRGPRTPSVPIVIVAIDEDSFDELDIAWPFPRALHGTLLEVIASGKPLAVGVDVLFPEPSVRGAEDDRELGEAVKRVGRRVVLGAAISFVTEGFYVKKDPNLPLALIREGAAAVAPVNISPDRDAVIRRVPVRHDVDGGAPLDSFDYALYRLAAANGLPVAPAPTRETLIINHRGPRRTYPWVSYHRVVQGDVDPAIFEGKIVLIGPTTIVLHDVFSTPFERGGEMPGVEIHASAIETLVRGDRIRVAPWQLSFLLALVGGPLGAFLVVQLRALRAFVVVVALWAVLGVTTFAAFSFANVWIMAVGPTAGLVLGYVATSIENFIREQREKRRLSQFFSPDVLREIVRHREDVQLGSARRLITVFFSDLRGFTSLSENMEPEIVAEMLREYLSEMTQIVFKHKGTVDKYIGDCVMAIWNAPFEDPDHAVNAVKTALDFQERTLAVSAKWEERIGGKIRNGCGINTGDAVVGTMGSRQRLEYTAIGDTVNLAARLESTTKEYNASIIISESTHEYVKGMFMTRELGAVTVKGKTQPVKIFAVLATDIRRHPRAALDAGATITLAGIDQTWQVRTRDISESGIALVGVPDDVDKGTIIEIRLDGGGLPKPITASGMVVWKRGDEAGVSFTEVSDDAAPVVSGYVSSHRPLK
jgi:adenylate cyclase